MARILLNYPASNVRLFFRIFFNVASALITIVGNECLTSRARVKLARGHAVPLPQLTSWLSSYTALSAWQKLRALPGGWLYPLMIFAYLLHLGSDYTTALLPTVSVRDRCNFGTGLVVSSNIMGLVPWNGRPYTVVAQAQVTSLLNSGLQGVYRKVNRALDFSADASDMLGQWQCARNPLELDYPWDMLAIDTVTSLQQHDLLYDNPSYVSSGVGNISHLVIADTSVGTNVDTVFDVRFSVETNAYGNTTRHMQSYQCVLNDTSGDLEHVQKGINSHQTLHDWIQLFQGAVYEGTGTPASNNTGGILEQLLNSMTMVAGGGNYLLNAERSDETQGCITRRTHILWELILLAGLTLFLVVSLLIYWLALIVHLNMIQRTKANSSKATSVKVDPPVGTFKWMAQAVTESRQPGIVAVGQQDLKQWSLGTSAKEGVYGVIRRGESSHGSEEGIALRPKSRS